MIVAKDKSTIGEFPKLRVKAFAPVQDRETNEAKYWKQFQITKQDKLMGTPVCIHFNPASKSNYLVTASTRVMLYNSLDDKLQRSFSRFEDEAFS